MDQLARSLLEKLLAQGEGKGAGVRERAAALTASRLAEYRNLRSWQAKQAFETTLLAARAQGAVRLTWDDTFSQDGFIARVDLEDLRKLAAFLGKHPVEDQVTDAREAFSTLMVRFPVLEDVLGRWAKLRKVRALSPESLQDWLDAARAIEFARANLEQATQDIPIREASARLFNDSKRIERLLAPVDILLSGDVGSEARQPSDVWQELGLFREEHPVRMAGNIIVWRERVTAYLDAPYSGLPAPSVLGL